MIRREKLGKLSALKLSSNSKLLQIENYHCIAFGKVFAWPKVLWPLIPKQPFTHQKFMNPSSSVSSPALKTVLWGVFWASLSTSLGGMTVVFTRLIIQETEPCIFLSKFPEKILGDYPFLEYLSPFGHKSSEKVDGLEIQVHHSLHTIVQILTL